VTGAGVYLDLIDEHDSECKWGKSWPETKNGEADDLAVREK
jgi:hypothetical protein